MIVMTYSPLSCENKQMTMHMNLMHVLIKRTALRSYIPELLGCLNLNVSTTA